MLLAAAAAYRRKCLSTTVERMYCHDLHICALRGKMMDIGQPRTSEAADVKPAVSIVVPCYNEAEVLPEFFSRLTKVLDELPYASTIIFVNDGSTDATLEVLSALALISSRVAVLNLSRNFGKEAAMTAGLDHAVGDAVIIIDADLQDPPEVIPELVERWIEGYDVVYAQRRARAGETLLKRSTSGAFYRLMRRASRIELPVDTGDFRLMSRRSVDSLCRLREHHRFMKGLFAWVGYRQVAVVYDRAPRYAGTTKWNYWKLWNFALDGITSFTTIPLRVATYVGFLLALLSGMYSIFIIMLTFLQGRAAPGYPSLMVVVLFLGGMQLLTLGILGEYIGRIFNEVKQRPIYLVQDFQVAKNICEEVKLNGS